MVRNLDLVRQLLIQSELKNSPSGWIIPKIDGFSADEVAYHINLLMQANLIDGIILTSADGYLFVIRNLTWEGHEFLDAARNDKTWNKAKQKLGSKIATLSFDLIKEVLINLAKQELGLS